jgi:16S rRNA (adenine1518-N6/adenine1519-N6)-dimethyltransferase
MVRILESRIEDKDFHLEGTELKINHIDVLKYEPDFSEYDVIANIPYYITSPILRHFLYETENKPKHMVILMQEDVGNKILGK